MQFEHPALLWALLLLLIPIIVHLFQLRRFKKTPFTNVAMLQKVVSESRKSSVLKKWLLLLARLGLLAALVIAFAKPFSAKKTALSPKETIVYLDNSFSMQAQSNGSSLLERAIQDLLKNIDAKTQFSLFTNSDTYSNISTGDHKNELLSIDVTTEQLRFSDILLKANTLFSNNGGNSKNLVLISDFQHNLGAFSDSISNHRQFMVNMRPESISNVSIDSIRVAENNRLSQTDLTVFLSGKHDANLPIALFDNDTLIAKTAVEFGENPVSEVVFSIPTGEDLNGRIEINDTNLSYDNTFYFTIGKRKKIDVLVISNTDTEYLRRIYTDDEFNLTISTLQQLDYSLIERQNIIVLDALTDIPQSLSQVLKSFKGNGGSLVIIPPKEADMDSYGPLLLGIGSMRFTAWVPIEKNISSISFQHPILANVFEREVSNFQYPKVMGYYRTKGLATSILRYDGNDSFLVGTDGAYVFTTPLQADNTNFKSSPLIVPIFYNMAVASLKEPSLYETLGQTSQIDMPVSTISDNILKLVRDDEEFIPRQRSFANKTTLYFDGNLTRAGTYTIRNGKENVGMISFNYPRSESLLRYQELPETPAVVKTDNLEEAFETLNAQNNITSYWKWFVILALFFALMEVFIQKLIP
ncbi:BatA domain-containing protein [Allomuricauda sp. SCSIO 65647]|uniref:BatA domain-containing protein n=1 Tax=Allomuricauda sp. SCSIO 65647 TaxID=2908843 RepID=UPI001F295DC4|nr:BatA domain-containing protein [Muricauda sp. SCSIO 65647]UJH67175.1 BatA domain-containing protein [Muricauda sp. SCSIO 65647]